MINYVYKNREDPNACYIPCGDIDGDGLIQPIDVVYMVNWVYKGLIPECPCGICATSSSPPTLAKGTTKELNVLLKNKQLSADMKKYSATAKATTTTPQATSKTTTATTPATKTVTSTTPKNTTNASSQAKITTPPLSKATSKKSFFASVGDFIKELF